jgi:predicted dehydrogenase
MADKAGLKIAVAHQMRIAPNILHLNRAIEAGLIGDLAQMHAYGKQDQRAGGEDLLVLGIHLFDLMRFFAGDAAWCTARVQQDGREITRGDGRSATENIGPSPATKSKLNSLSIGASPRLPAAPNFDQLSNIGA